MSLYEIAFQLKMPVYKLKEMPYDELLGWHYFFEKYPADWRDDLRTFRFVQTQGFKGNPWDIFPSLYPILNRPRSENLDVMNLKRSTIYHKMLGAKGGEKLNFD